MSPDNLKQEIRAIFVGNFLSYQPLSKEMESKVEKIYALVRERERRAAWNVVKATERVDNDGCDHDGQFLDHGATSDCAIHESRAAASKYGERDGG